MMTKFCAYWHRKCALDTHRYLGIVCHEEFGVDLLKEREELERNLKRMCVCV